MSQEKFGFGDIIVSAITIEKASKIRSKILAYTPRTWVYVLNNKEGICDLSIANHTGNKLSKDEILEIKDMLHGE